MKKIYWLIILLVLFTTGCSNINKINTNDLVDLAMKSKNNKTNSALKGYKLYIPIGMELVRDINNNNVLYSSGDKYYLYVDLISYYNKKTNDYKIKEQEVFYNKELNYNNKTGYILVTKYKTKYFVEVMYNYAKIEVISSDYKVAVLKALIVLKNNVYNDTIIKSLMGANILKYNEEKYDLLGPSKGTTNVLEWNYDDVDNELKDLDEDIIDVQSE